MLSLVFYNESAMSTQALSIKEQITLNPLAKLFPSKENHSLNLGFFFCILESKKL